MNLRSQGVPVSVRVGSSGTRLYLRLVSTDSDGNAIIEQTCGLLIRGYEAGDDFGPPAPDHRLPSESRGELLGTGEVAVTDDQPVRYAKASGDDSAIHMSEEHARAAGLPGVILQGMCTMAMCSQAVIALAGAGDPTRLSRIAVRFAGLVRPGDELVTSVYSLENLEAPPHRRVVGFEAATGNGTVIKDGRAELWQ